MIGYKAYKDYTGYQKVVYQGDIGIIKVFKKFLKNQSQITENHNKIELKNEIQILTPISKR